MITFDKMHALGNDFVLINSLKHPFNRQAFSIDQLSDRHSGIGFDQLLVLKRGERTAFACEIYNADGSEALQCGNGLRCVAAFLIAKSYITEVPFRIETKAGLYSFAPAGQNLMSMTMGTPQVQEKAVNLQLEVGGDPLILRLVSMGNPHAILRVIDLSPLFLETMANKINASNLFPQGINIGFMQVASPSEIYLRTYERGTGLTLACGSNAAAAVAIGIVQGWLNDRVQVHFQRGSLWVDWNCQDELSMIGPAQFVFSGCIY